jgi:hypothetical protein
MIRVAVGFVLGAAAAVLGDYMARSILAHAEMRAEEEKPPAVPPLMSSAELRAQPRQSPPPGMPEWGYGRPIGGPSPYLRPPGF